MSDDIFAAVSPNNNNAFGETAESETETPSESQTENEPDGNDANEDSEESEEEDETSEESTKYKDVPFHKHPRFKKLIGERKELLTKVEAQETQLADALLKMREFDKFKEEINKQNQP